MQDNVSQYIYFNSFFIDGVPIILRTGIILSDLLEYIIKNKGLPQNDFIVYSDSVQAKIFVLRILL